MLAKILILEQTGNVSGVFGVIPTAFMDMDKQRKDVLSHLRHDYEKNIHGAGAPKSNPSQNPAKVKFVTYPFMYKQERARNIPLKISQTVTLIDSFTCLGSRFELDSLTVIVEVYESTYGGNYFWAEIFYAHSCEIPACIIRAKEHAIILEKENIINSGYEW